MVIVVLGKHESLDLRPSPQAKLEWSYFLFFYYKKLFSKKGEKAARELIEPENGTKRRMDTSN